MQQTHKLVTDLIILMPLKIKELRKMSDASQWISLANFISEFYGATAELNLHQEFWNAALQVKSTHRCLALHDFLRIDMLPIQLYVPIRVRIYHMGSLKNAEKKLWDLLHRRRSSRTSV